MDEITQMHATTVEVLVNKARLEPSIAVAFAEAIDMAICNSQLVTVPVLDARFATFEAKVEARFAAIDARFTAFEAKVDARFAASEARVDAKIEKCKAELVRWVFLVMLGNVALSAGATALLNALQHSP
jgi:hypothetical protein